jgi:hypothetical protein
MSVLELKQNIHALIDEMDDELNSVIIFVS